MKKILGFYWCSEKRNFSKVTRSYLEKFVVVRIFNIGVY